MTNNCEWKEININAIRDNNQYECYNSNNNNNTNNNNNNSLTRDNCGKMAENSIPATFEEAIEATGCGIFNIVLLCVALFATFANTFSTTSISYILPKAECDLKLTLINKGTLNAATYVGIVCSSIMWGYLSDTTGRKKILVYGYIMDFVCVVCCALSLNFNLLVTLKFLEGFIISGPSTVLYSYYTEVHNSRQRPRIFMALGVFQSLGTVILPLLAWWLLPQHWNLLITDNFNLHSWNIFLMVCSIPSLFAGLLILTLPESPKFLMWQGHNEQALESFRHIYAWNARKSRLLYPIHCLVEEVPNRDPIYAIQGTDIHKNPTDRGNLLKSLQNGWGQMRPMFHKPLLQRTSHVYLMQFCILLGLNTIRLWLPQLFAFISEYEHLMEHKKSSDLCTILEYSVNRTISMITSNNDTCIQYQDISIDMYMNNIIISLVSLVGYAIASFIVKCIDTKHLLVYGLLISGCFGLSFYWSTDATTTLILSAMFISVTGISTSSLMTTAITLFPTTLRTVITAVALMFGRLGALSGNLLFPIFMEMGCLPPFILVGAVLLLAGCLALCLPNPKKTAFT